MADDREYMTPREFAALTSDARHAVWDAHANRRVEAIRTSAGSANGMLRYHRGQVMALLREAEASRG